jgi:hypothetical protein
MAVTSGLPDAPPPSPEEQQKIMKMLYNQRARPAKAGGLL